MNQGISFDPEECPSEAIRFVRKPSLHEVISDSQSAILPANALRLHIDDPSAPLPTPQEPSYSASDLLPYGCQQPRARVRFRSRVRITSGFNRHRRTGDPEDISSRSSSRSSSISAPLRSHAENRTTAWGTLGQRVGLLSLQKKIINSPQLQQRQNKHIRFMTPNDNTDERTPLRGSSNLVAYGEGESIQAGDNPDEDETNNRLSKEVDKIFGKFPGRLLNYHVCRPCCPPIRNVDVSLGQVVVVEN